MSERVWLYPSSAERQYGALLRGYVSTISAETMRVIKDSGTLRNDDWSSDVTAMFLELAAYALGIGESVIVRLPEVYANINKFNDRQWRLIVKAGTGLDISESSALPSGARLYGNVSDPTRIRARFGVGVDVYRSEPWLMPRMENWIAQNTQLIKSVPEQYLTQVQTVLRQGVMNGIAPGALAKEISEKTGVTLRRANIIARDQVSKANSDLSEYRMKDLGVDSYVWNTVHDERVRPTHRLSDGQTYTFKEGSPHANHRNPGQEILCRCWARPVF